MIGPVSYVGSYLPLTLSFGSGRREQSLAHRFLCGLCSKRLYHSGICRDYEQWKFNGKLNALIAVLFIFMTAVGQLISVAQMHFGIKGMIIGIVIVVLCMVGGFVTGIGLLTRSWRGSTEYRRM